MAESILQTILASIRQRLPARKREMPERVLRERQSFERDPRSLASALRCSEMAYIAELKKASPSAGVIRMDFDVPSLAKAYTAVGAEALSVVTEPEFFLGSIDNLDVARRCTDVPLLRKDFIVDPYQIVEARAYGADAVLLIVAALSPGQLRELQDAAAEIELSVLVEIHNQAELESLDLNRTHILGVNNRDLVTFEVDTGLAPRLLAHVPEHIIRVAESGMRTGADVATARFSGIDAVLIGERFMRGADPGAELASLREEVRRLVQTTS